MTEAQTVLYRRKIELKQLIETKKRRENELLTSLKNVRGSIEYHEKLLEEIEEVYNKLTD